MIKHKNTLPKAAMTEVKKQINYLKSVIQEHDHCYYVLDDPKISDHEYDNLLRKLKEIEEAYPECITPDSPTQRVGGSPISEFNQIQHTKPMLSLGNAFGVDELKAFNKRINDTLDTCLLYTSPSPRDRTRSRMPSSA